MIRLYGHARGSFKTVTEGLELAFQELGVLDGTFYGESEFGENVGGAFSPIAVVTGDPMRVLQAHYHGQHQKKFLLLAPNSEGIDRALVRQLKDKVKLPNGEKVPTLDGFLAPSKWAVGVLQKCFPEHLAIYCPHGVMPHFRMDRSLREQALQELRAGSFKALHVTSSRLSRKGTDELLRAWSWFVEEEQPTARLDILVNPEYWQEFQGKAESVKGVNVYPGQNFSASEYVQLLHQYNAVIQPSRAEGFGLVPLEARACGVPAVATCNTGHLDHHSGPGTVRVEDSQCLLGDSDDYLGAMALIVSAEEILDSLKEVVSNAERLHHEAVEAADEIVKNWSWVELTRPALERMKQEIQ